MAMGARIKERLDELGWKQVELLRLVPDLTVGTLSAMIARDSKRSEHSEAIAEALGLAHRYLQSGEGPRLREDAGDASRQRPETGDGDPAKLTDYVVVPGGRAPAADDVVLVEHLPARGSCGGGAINGHEDEPRMPLAFKKDWLQAKGVRPEDAFIIDGDGGSMEPFICHGDVVLFNRARATPLVSGRIYAIEHPDGLRIKRVFIEMDRSMILRSDNADKRLYPDERVPPDIVPQVRVLGGFVWRGGG